MFTEFAAHKVGKHIRNPRTGQAGEKKEESLRLLKHAGVRIVHIAYQHKSRERERYGNGSKKNNRNVFKFGFFVLHKHKRQQKNRIPDKYRGQRDIETIEHMVFGQGWNRRGDRQAHNPHRQIDYFGYTLNLKHCQCRKERYQYPHQRRKNVNHCKDGQRAP